MAGKHTRLNILVEGQTEESFVRELIVPHLAGFEVWVHPASRCSWIPAYAGMTAQRLSRPQ